MRMRMMGVVMKRLGITQLIGKELCAFVTISQHAL